MIAFSGIPGSGKTTQARALARLLSDAEVDVEFVDLHDAVSRARSFVSRMLSHTREPLRMNVDADVASFCLFDQCLRRLETRERGVYVVDPSPESILAGYRARGAATAGLEAIGRVVWKPSIEIRLNVRSHVVLERIFQRRGGWGADSTGPLDVALLNAWSKELAMGDAESPVVHVDGGGAVPAVTAASWEGLSMAGVLQRASR